MILADYTNVLEHHHIEGGALVGDGRIDEEDFTFGFKTGGRHPDASALLFCVYRGLTEGEASVEINGFEIGRLPALPNDRDFATQLFTFPAERLQPDDFNFIKINAVPRVSPAPGDLFDDFMVRELVCFFHQDR